MPFLSKMADIPKLQQIACKTIDACSAELNHLSQEIWKHPEKNFEEVFAHNLLTKFLSEKGFSVTSGCGGLKTAFRAVYNDGVKGPRVGIICEYDALPDINHACGHNLIAEAGITAALGGYQAISLCKWRSVIHIEYSSFMFKLQKRPPVMYKSVFLYETPGSNLPL